MLGWRVMERRQQLKKKGSTYMTESMVDIARRRAAELGTKSEGTGSQVETEVRTLRQIAQERAVAFATPALTSETSAVGPAIEAVVVEDASTTTVSGKPVHPAEGGTRPRRGTKWVWGRRLLIGFAAWNIVTLTGRALFGGFRQEEVDPRANPWPYARGVVLVFGDPESKMGMLNQFDKYVGDCNIGQPFGVSGAPDEEFQYARPLWNVYKYVEENRATDLRNWAVRARINAQLNDDMEQRVIALSSAMAAEADPYLKIDVFVGQISAGLPTDGETNRKIQAVKAMLWQGESNRQRTPLWGKLPEDYSVLPSGSLKCKLVDGNTGVTTAEKPKTKLELRRAYTNTREAWARKNNTRG